MRYSQRSNRAVKTCGMVLILLVPVIPGAVQPSTGADQGIPEPEEAPAAEDTTLHRPSWAVGDSWTIVTLTQPLQGRSTKAVGEPGYIPWRFEVKAIESIAETDCYRIDVQCQAKGRLRPSTTIWCDCKTLFLRQFETQVAVGGNYRRIRESYQPAADGYAPVLPPINALPIAIPAFLPKGSKRASKSFQYTSRPLPAGAKDLDVVKFSHRMTQEVVSPGAKSLKQVPRSYAKSLDKKPIVEVHLKDYAQDVVQLWQQDAPWPVYVDNGRTQAWLVADQPGK